MHQRIWEHLVIASESFFASGKFPPPGANLNDLFCSVSVGYLINNWKGKRLQKNLPHRSIDRHMGFLCNIKLDKSLVGSIQPLLQNISYKNGKYQKSGARWNIFCGEIEIEGRAYKIYELEWQTLGFRKIYDWLNKLKPTAAKPQSSRYISRHHFSD